MNFFPILQDNDRGNSDRHQHREWSGLAEGNAEREQRNSEQSLAKTNCGADERSNKKNR